MTGRVIRNAVVALLGTPDRTEGSVNDPRERREGPLEYNEKWFYDHLENDPAGAAMRLVLWHRYDFVATFVRSKAEEPWRPDEKLAQALENNDSHLSGDLDPARNPPLPPTRRYRPVSDFKGKRDLGGYIQS